MENYDHLLTELEHVLKRNRRFDHIYKEFESEKFCYLSLISFLLKPLQRLLHYEYLLESKQNGHKRLMKAMIDRYSRVVDLLQAQ